MNFSNFWDLNTFLEPYFTYVYARKNSAGWNSGLHLKKIVFLYSYRLENKSQEQFLGHSNQEFLINSEHSHRCNYYTEPQDHFWWSIFHKSNTATANFIVHIIPLRQMHIFSGEAILPFSFYCLSRKWSLLKTYFLLIGCHNLVMQLYSWYFIKGNMSHR